MKNYENKYEFSKNRIYFEMKICTLLFVKIESGAFWRSSGVNTHPGKSSGFRRIAPVRLEFSVM